MSSSLSARWLLAMILIGGLAVATAKEPPRDVAYHKLKPSIVSNLTGGPRYIRCDIQLMTEYASTLPKIELHEPALRHRILMLIAGQDGNALRTRDGKEAFRLRALEAVQAELEELTGEKLVADLYFTSFYVK
jgi:flagellar protein FliL